MKSNRLSPLRTSRTFLRTLSMNKMVTTTMIMMIIFAAARTCTGKIAEVEIGADGFETRGLDADLDRELQTFEFGKGNDNGGGNNGGCPGPLRQFQSEVLVDFNGYDDDYKDITSISFTALEQAFRDSYNSLSNDSCDDKFRRIIDVQIVPNANGEIAIPRGGFEFSIRYLITAVCRGCSPGSITLFSPPDNFAFRKLGGYDETESKNGSDVAANGESHDRNGQMERRAKSDKKSKKDSKSSKGTKGHKGAKNGKKKRPTHPPRPDDDFFGKGNDQPGKGTAFDDDFFGKGNDQPGKGNGPTDDDFFGKGNGNDQSCDCDSKFPTYTAPTESEFCKTYDAAIKIFGEKTRPHRRGGVTVDNLVKCTEVVDESCSVIQEEFQALVAVEFFGDRTAVTDEERVVLGQNFVEAYNGLQDNRCDSPVFRTAVLADVVLVSDIGDPLAFIYVFAVDGTCRGGGCSDELQFFQADTIARSRRLQRDTEECGCPVFTTGELIGPPTTTEMEMRYFQVVQDLREIGLLPNVGASGEVYQLPFEFPTPPPTFAPNISPPTPAPAPVVQPTFGPNESSSPTGTASPTQGAAPSGSNGPSIAPSTTFGPSVSLAPSPTDNSRSPSVSDEPTISDQPSVSNAPSPTDNSVSPSVSDEPTISDQPSVSNAPSPTDNSRSPSVSDEPTISDQPSVSNAPSPTDNSRSPSVSDEPTISDQPSVSNAPSPTDNSRSPSVSDEPTVSDQPSVSNAPSPTDNSRSPSVSDEPSVSDQPSVSVNPTTNNQLTQRPSVSLQPSITPSSLPSRVPSQTPSLVPSNVPSTQPSIQPSLSQRPST